MRLPLRILCLACMCATFSSCASPSQDSSAQESPPSDESSVQTRGTIRDKIFNLPSQRPSPQLNLPLNLLVGANPGSTAYLYGILPDGSLKWYRHNGVERTEGGGIGPNNVGVGWQIFKQVFAGGGNIIYGITPHGILKWYSHTGFADGTFTWIGAKDVGIGWQNFKQVFSGSDGIIYAITTDGNLLWYRHNGFKEGTGLSTPGSWTGPKPVGVGWQNFKHVFGGCNGVIYAITPDGTLKWYKHTGYPDGSPTWQGPITVGSGWQNFTQVFSACDGKIYALQPNGILRLYCHTGYATGQATWEQPIDTWIGLPSFLTMFALLQYTPPPAPVPASKLVELDVLTYNIYMLPTTLKSTNQATRARLLPGYLQNYEVIIFNEAFDDDVRKILLDGMSLYPNRTKILGSDRLFDQDGGVIILSKWQIQAEAERFYGSNCTGTDCRAQKGVKYAKVCKEGHPFHIFGTHTNANHDPLSIRARTAQFQILRQFIDDMKIPNDEPVLIAGDMNVPKFFPKLFIEYEIMLDTLGAGDPSGDGPPFLDQRAYPGRPYCTYCYGFNDLADDPDDGQTILDYVLYSLRHKAPSKATTWFQQPRQAWYADGKVRYDLSDHFPQLGKFQFEFPTTKRC